MEELDNVTALGIQTFYYYFIIIPTPNHGFKNQIRGKIKFAFGSQFWPVFKVFSKPN